MRRGPQPPRNKPGSGPLQCAGSPKLSIGMSMARATAMLRYQPNAERWLSARFTLAGGVYALRAQAHAEAPRYGKRVDFVGAAGLLGAGGVWRVAQRHAVVADAAVLISLPNPKLYFNELPSARLAWPALWLDLGWEVEF